MMWLPNGDFCWFVLMVTGSWVRDDSHDGVYSSIGKCTNFVDSFWKACMASPTNGLAFIFVFAFPMIME